MKIVILGNDIEALVANYVLADLGFSPTMAARRLPNPNHNLFAHGPWRHTGDSPLLAQMLEDLELDYSEYELETALDGQDRRSGTWPVDVSQYPDCVRGRKRGTRKGLAFNREEFFSALCDVASVDLEMVLFDGDSPALACDKLITTRPEILTEECELMITIEGADNRLCRFNVAYFTNSPFRRVTQAGSRLRVQTNGDLGAIAEKLGETFGACAQIVSHMTCTLPASNYYYGGYQRPDSALKVHSLGSASGWDRTISETIDYVSALGSEWKA